MKNEIFNLIESKSPGSIPLYLVIRGSHAYGTNLPTSDTDYCGVFIQKLDDILGYSYVEQINDDKNDIVIYEIRRFLELIAKNNPNILELLNSPEDCIIYKHPSFDDILKNRSSFITKLCAASFAGYASAQIQKASGQDKKQNWEKDRMLRKNPLDFCYLHKGEKSIPLSDFFDEKGIDQRFCGLSKMPHSKDLYSLFYDFKAEDSNGETNPLGFRGIAFENSNDIRLSSIPLDCSRQNYVGYVSYNKDAYMQHCNDYKSYQEWLEKRNDQRWVDVKSHNQKIDGKNMMHCRRLMDMAREIAEGKGINVRRGNAKDLIDIRQGKVDLSTLIEYIKEEIKQVDILYKNSDLPDKVDMKFIEKLLIDIRKKTYKVK